MNQRRIARIKATDRMNNIRYLSVFVNEDDDSVRYHLINHSGTSLGLSYLGDSKIQAALPAYRRHGDAKLVEHVQTVLRGYGHTLGTELAPGVQDNNAIEIGDSLTFRSVTRHSAKKVTRKVTGFWHTTDGEFPTVRYEGWSNFVVKPEEIIHIQKAGT